MHLYLDFFFFLRIWRSIFDNVELTLKTDGRRNWFLFFKSLNWFNELFDKNTNVSLIFNGIHLNE